jgi:hypothetical protein
MGMGNMVPAAHLLGLGTCYVDLIIKAADFNKCPNGNLIFWSNIAFSEFFDPRRSAATPAVKKFLRPCL